MLAEAGLRTLAKEIKAAQDNVQQLEPFTSRLPEFDIVDGYKIAHLIHHDRLAEGATVIGRKIGFTNPDMWAKYGVREPIWAHIYDTTVVYLDKTRSTCRLNRFTEPKIEPEIILQFKAAPQAGTGIDGVLDAIGWAAHGFEIVQSHFPGWKFQAPDTVADWALHGTLLIGPPQSLTRLGNDVSAALESFELILSCDDQYVETGKGSNVLGSPLAAIAHLLSVLGKQPDYTPLQSGEIVTTGTITTARTVQSGETWKSELQGIPLPGLTVSFTE